MNCLCLATAITLMLNLSSAYAHEQALEASVVDLVHGLSHPHHNLFFVLLVALTVVAWIKQTVSKKHVD